MNAREVSRPTARSPFLRNKINVIHYRPGEEREKVRAQNEPLIVCMGFERVGLCCSSHVNHDARKLMLTFVWGNVSAALAAIVQDN